MPAGAATGARCRIRTGGGYFCGSTTRLLCRRDPQAHASPPSPPLMTRALTIPVVARGGIATSAGLQRWHSVQTPSTMAPGSSPRTRRQSTQTFDVRSWTTTSTDPDRLPHLPQHAWHGTRLRTDREHRAASRRHLQPRQGSGDGERGSERVRGRRGRRQMVGRPVSGSSIRWAAVTTSSKLSSREPKRPPGGASPACWAEQRWRDQLRGRSAGPYERRAKGASRIRSTTTETSRHPLGALCRVPAGCVLRPPAASERAWTWPAAAWCVIRMRTCEGALRRVCTPVTSIMVIGAFHWHSSSPRIPPVDPGDRRVRGGVAQASQSSDDLAPRRDGMRFSNKRAGVRCLGPGSTVGCSQPRINPR